MKILEILVFVAIISIVITLMLVGPIVVYDKLIPDPFWQTVCLFGTLVFYVALFSVLDAGRKKNDD